MNTLYIKGHSSLMIRTHVMITDKRRDKVNKKIISASPPKTRAQKRDKLFSIIIIINNFRVCCRGRFAPRKKGTTQRGRFFALSPIIFAHLAMQNMSLLFLIVQLYLSRVLFIYLSIHLSNHLSIYLFI